MIIKFDKTSKTYLLKINLTQHKPLRVSQIICLFSFDPNLTREKLFHSVLGEVMETLQLRSSNKEYMLTALL